MIKTFRSKKLARYWIKGDARGVPSDHLKRLNLRLTALDEAAALDDMDVPGWHFPALRVIGRAATRCAPPAIGA
jgi:toxin HigB-1